MAERGGPLTPRLVGQAPGGHGLWRLACAVMLVLAQPSRAEGPTHHPGGFWKCRSGGDVKAEFSGEDPVGLAGHAHVKTDCALHWSDGHGKTYCFASNPSYLEFSENADVLPKARAFWARQPRP